MKYLLLLLPLLLLPSSFSCLSLPSPIILPPLPYAYDGLEPVISKQIMTLHHTKHHQAYINNYNTAVGQLLKALDAGDLETVESLQVTIKFNLGGYLNHAFFWTVLAPISSGGGVLPSSSSSLTKQVIKIFGGYDKLITLFNDKGGKLQGSGWTWLVVDNSTKNLSIFSTANQDPATLEGFTPIFGVDVWEHAYYLQYLNVRADYLTNIWKIVNWVQVEKNYINAIKA